MVTKTTPAGSTRETVMPLSVAYPQEVYSLSHVAIPFPPDDDLYGRHPEVKTTTVSARDDSPVGRNIGSERWQRCADARDVESVLRLYADADRQPYRGELSPTWNRLGHTGELC